MDIQLCRILVVDDDILFQKIALCVLAPICSEVNLANNGAEALDHLRRKRYDLVMVDLGMPGVGGFTVIEHMKQDPDLAQVPVVVITGNGCVAATNKAAQLGVSLFVSKPVRWRALPALVRGMLDVSRPNKPNQKLETIAAAHAVGRPPSSIGVRSW